MWFKKKEEGTRVNVVEEHFVPSRIPTYTGLETFRAADYSYENPEALVAAFERVVTYLSDLIATTDHHSTGIDGDNYVTNEMHHIWADHAAEKAEHDNQIVRIRNAITMRINDLKDKHSSGMKSKDKLIAEIEPLEGLRPHFQLHVGRHTISVGVIVTLLAIIIDSVVFWGYLQNIILGNGFMLVISVLAMALMSDFSTYMIGLLYSRRNHGFIAKPLMWSGCAFFGALFIVSVVATVMMKFGAMSSTFGTIDAAGNFIPKEGDYNLAEYGATLAQSFVPLITAGASFFFSLGDNNYLISVREKLKRELAELEVKLSDWSNELVLLENAPDFSALDAIKRESAEAHIKALENGLKLHLRKMAAERIADPSFTEKMTASGNAIFNPENSVKGTLTPVTTNVSLNKAS